MLNPGLGGVRDVTSAIISHLPLSLINRPNKTESAVFKLWMLYFQRIILQISLSNFLKYGSYNILLGYVIEIKSLQDE